MTYLLLSAEHGVSKTLVSNYRYPRRTEVVDVVDPWKVPYEQGNIFVETTRADVVRSELKVGSYPLIFINDEELL